MDYCQSKQLRPKTMASYEQTLKLFARWMEEEKRIARAAIARVSVDDDRIDVVFRAEIE